MGEAAIYLLIFIASTLSYIKVYRSPLAWEGLNARRIGWEFGCPPGFAMATMFVIYEGLGGTINFFSVFFIIASVTLGPAYLIYRFKKRNRRKYR